MVAKSCCPRYRSVEQSQGATFILSFVRVADNAREHVGDFAFINRSSCESLKFVNGASIGKLQGNVGSCATNAIPAQLAVVLRERNWHTLRNEYFIGESLKVLKQRKEDIEHTFGRFASQTGPQYNGK